MNRTALLSVLLVITAAGCLERVETITVHEDGSVAFLCEYSTDSLAELQNGDAMPSLQGGWLVLEKVENRADGEKTYRLTAETMRHPGAELPRNYATFHDPDSELYLQFPSQLQIERRRDETLYHFSRRYTARPWAYLEGSRAVLTEELAKLEERDLEDLPPEELAGLVQGLLRVITLKHEAFARKAFLEAVPDAPQDAFLTVRTALAHAVEEIDAANVLDLMKDPEDEEATQRLEEMWKGFEARLIEIAEDAFQEHPQIRREQVNAFVGAMKSQQRSFAITEDLADDTFQINVRMPGEIVAHNAERLVDNEVIWKFTGEMIRDREVELLVTSVVR